MAFPSDSRKDDDPHMLEPFDPEHFAAGHVHIERGDQTGFLFRIDPQPGGGVGVLVLSATKPDWAYAFHNAKHLLAAAAPELRPVHLTTEAGSRFRFRLAANPVFRVREASADGRGNRIDAKWIGKRIPVPSDEASLRNWLERRAAPAGFSLKEISLLQSGYVYVNKTRDSTKGQRLRSVRYEGVLEVVDPERFRRALASGIGPAKAFGFGLLSIAPIAANAPGMNFAS